MSSSFKFTKTKLEALEYASPGKRRYYQDEETPGLGLTVTDKSKTFFVPEMIALNEPVVLS